MPKKPTRAPKKVVLKLKGGTIVFPTATLGSGLRLAGQRGAGKRRPKKCGCKKK